MVFDIYVHVASFTIVNSMLLISSCSSKRRQYVFIKIN